MARQECRLSSPKTDRPTISRISLFRRTLLVLDKHQLDVRHVIIALHVRCYTSPVVTPYSLRAFSLMGLAYKCSSPCQRGYCGPFRYSCQV